ncbi:hypothetical protein D5085_06860 [Ectothiorhodospiraceae bacterium BW-2]|nr:hypothetical protein D5085_06860 [Ectothiorhodospiraceae bacterium BW-2]
MKKLLLLGCETMREGVIVSFVFFILGILMVLAGAHLVPDWLYMNFVVLLLGFLLVLFAPVILVSTYLLSVLPGIRERLKEECEH